MSRIKICAAEEQIKKNVSGAQAEFIRHCRIRNLSLRTIDYYQEDIFTFFLLKRTFAFFDQNIVSEYPREQARAILVGLAVDDSQCNDFILVGFDELPEDSKVFRVTIRSGRLASVKISIMSAFSWSSSSREPRTTSRMISCCTLVAIAITSR